MFVATPTLPDIGGKVEMEGNSSLNQLWLKCLTKANITEIIKDL